MSENKFTPGPWELITDEEEMYYAGGRLPFVKVAEKRNILIEGRNFEEAIANANLITAAPELLDALEEAVQQMEMAAECIEKGMNDEALLHLRSLMRQKREVIAKAKGE